MCSTGTIDLAVAIAVKTSVGNYRMVLPPRRHIECTAIELPGVLRGARWGSGPSKLAENQEMKFLYTFVFTVSIIP